jgi:hypothetical protein
MYRELALKSYDGIQCPQRVYPLQHLTCNTVNLDSLVTHGLSHVMVCFNEISFKAGTPLY